MAAPVPLRSRRFPQLTAPEPERGPQSVSDQATHELLEKVNEAIGALELARPEVEIHTVEAPPDPRFDQLARSLGELHSVLLEVATRPPPVIPAPQVTVGAPDLTVLEARLDALIQSLRDERDGIIDAVKKIRPQVTATSGTLGNRVVESYFRAIQQAVEGTLSVSGSFYPATQPVSGTVTTADSESAALSANTGTVTSSGDNTLVVVGATETLRLRHISFVPDPASANDVVVTVKLGSTAKYTWRCNKAGSGFSRTLPDKRWVQTAAGDDLVLNLSTAANVSWNAEYDLV